MRMRGYTLLEMLIALVLLSLLATSSGAIYIQAMDSQRRSQQRQFSSFSAYMREALVRQSVAATLPYAVLGEDSSPGFYFLGRDDGMTGVTARPVSADAKQVGVYRLFSEETPYGEFKLVYEEAILQQPLINAEQKLDFQLRLELGVYTQVAEFEYLVLGDGDVSSGQLVLPVNRWVPQHDALQYPAQPERARIQVGPGQTVHFLFAGGQGVVAMSREP